MAEIKININGIEITGHENQTILSVAQENGIDIPTLCHDERVKTYGACGLCVVETENSPKLLRACSTVIADGMIIKTDTDRVNKSRKSALELLISDHAGDCRPPCALACPAGTDCQGYVGLIANGKYSEALDLIREKIPFPSSIGRVCPHPCEEACRRKLVEEPVSIAQLKYFVGDMQLQDQHIPNVPESTGHSVAIIGGGPGGLTAAYFLRMQGHNVTVYDSMPRMGGMLRYGIPEYRLPKAVLDSEIEVFEKMGIRFINGVKVGRDISLDHIRRSHSAVVIAIGAWFSIRLNCPGEDLEGVVGGIDFLRDAALDRRIALGKRVAVVGGGNTAMDACRTAVRLGAEKVICIYRRSRAEMPAEDVEIEEAIEEGVEFKFLTNPTEIVGKTRVTKIRLQKMRLGEPDAGGRRSPVPIQGAEETIGVDTVVIAIGQTVNLEGFSGLELTKRKTISADEFTYRTNIEGVFAVGDATNKGASIAIEAIGEAEKAAAVIDRYLFGQAMPYSAPYVITSEVTKEKFAGREKAAREKMILRAANERKNDFLEINHGYNAEQARRESKRCLECGCADYFECKLLKYANRFNVTPHKYQGEVRKRPIDVSNPFFYRNQNKCILCGLCVRVCDEVMGRTALGLVNRGFDTIVEPFGGQPEVNCGETDCISCGQCVALCPTGALGEFLPIEKSVPLRENRTHTTCSFCGVGCDVEITSYGDIVLRHLPGDNNGLLCAKGRFGFGLIQKHAPNVIPMINMDGKRNRVTLEHACLYAKKQIQSIAGRYGADSIAVAVSGKYTNEDIFMVVSYAGDVLGTRNIGSFGHVRGGIKDVMGYDASPNTLDELRATEVILLVADNIMDSHTIAGLKIKQAVENGAKLILISNNESQASEWASLVIKPGRDLNALRQMAKALIYGDKSDVNGIDTLAEYLSRITPSAEIQVAMEMYTRAKKAMLVFDQQSLTPDAARLLADIAVLSGHIGKPRSGMIQLKTNNNSQGLTDMGITMGYEELVAAVNSNRIKALLIFGEDVPEVNLGGLEFLLVQDCVMTETMEYAHIVLPAELPYHRAGTYTGTDRRIGQVTPICTENISQTIKIINNLSDSIKCADTYTVRSAISSAVPEYKGMKNVVNTFWPIGASPVLYESGFNTPDKKAKLAIPAGNSMYREKRNTNAEYNRFTQFISNPH